MRNRIYAIVIKLQNKRKNYCKNRKRNVRYKHQNENANKNKRKENKRL